MKKYHIAGLAGACLLATAGVAAAQPYEVGPRVYLGGHLGYAFQPEDDDESVVFDTDLDGQFDDQVNTTAPANAFSPGFCGGSANGATPAAGCDDDQEGVDAGVSLGWDFWTRDRWVVGAVGDISYVDIDDAVSAFSTTPASYTFNRELNWLAAGRLRAGYAFNTFLLYGTGGVAWGDIEHDFSTTNGVNTFTPTDDDGAFGYQAGFGGEMQVSDRMSVGLEYIYTTLEDEDYTVRTSGPAPATNPFILVNPAGTDLRRSDTDFEFDSVRFTVSYRLGT